MAAQHQTASHTQLCLGRRNAFNRGGNGCTVTDSSAHNNAWVGETHLIGVLMAAQQQTAAHKP